MDSNRELTTADKGVSADKEVSRLQAAAEEDDDLELSLEALSALRGFLSAPPGAAPPPVSTMKDARAVLTGVEDNTQFQKKEYWEERFAEEPEYDWLVSFAAIEPHVKQLISPDQRVLIVGCGNSTLSADMYAAGYTNIVNIDFSAVVIDCMATKHADLTDMSWRTMDMTKMDGFGDGEFDVVLDKAAMDAIVTNEGDPWHPDEETVAKVSAMCREVSRVLKPKGKFVQVTFQQPHFRNLFLDRPGNDFGWIVPEPTKLDEGLGYFIYNINKM